MNTICHLCNTIFKRHYNLKIHLKDHRCKSSLLENLYDLNIFLNDKIGTINKYKYLLVKNGINDPDNQLYINNKSVNIQNSSNSGRSYSTVKNNSQTDMSNMKFEEPTTVSSYQLELNPINNNQKPIIKRGRPKKVVTETIQQIKRKVGRPKKESIKVLELQVNPITKLNLNNNLYNTEQLLIQYEKHKHDNILGILLSNYIEKIINNKDIPENLCVKYIKKKPPTYVLNIVDENDKLKTKTIIKTLKDSCNILHDIFAKIIRIELKRQLRILRQRQSKESEESDESEEEEYDNDTIFFLMKELKDKKKNIIKQAIKSVLSNNILYDKSMKTKL